MRMKPLMQVTLRILPLLFAGMSALAVTPKDENNVPSVLEGDAIVRRNGTYFNNRPLYGGQTDPQKRYYWVFAGDRPFLRFGGGVNLDGCFMLGFQRAGGTAKWLLDFKSVEARYHAGRMEWVASDPEFSGVTIVLHALPMGTGFGMAAQAQITGAASGDRLVWMLGAASIENVQFNDAMAADSAADVRKKGFDPARAEGNGVEVANGVIRLDHARGVKGRHTLATCSAASEVRTADADQWKTPATLLASAGDKRPVACGVTPIVGNQPITWIAHVWLQNEAATAPDVMGEFRAAWDRTEQLSNRVVSKTPDARFDFMVRAASAPVEGLWREKAYGHGCLSQFVDPLLGWRSTLAGVAYGWHDRVMTAAKYFFASQVTGESYKDHPELRRLVESSPELPRYAGTGVHPGADPRFHSKGRLIPNWNSMMYDMQSQFVDAVVEDWRFTADPELEKLLRPALELHLDYIARVFDPAGNGIYESLSNTFLTDSVWTNGGGTPDETAFAWRGHLAARDMARRAGDEAAVKKHEAKLALIRKGFFEKLWVDKLGIPGAYREQGGHQRLHPDPWTPGLYLPMDCKGLLNDEQMASMAYFTEYGLQREPRPSGGVRLYPSNWVPAIWSNREKSPGDEYHMALGYCFAGMPEGAMEIINGNISECAFESAVPGNLGVPYGSCGTDFGDCVSAFARTVVSGIFGYRPDRPNERVTIAPQFPATWDHASFEHPEFKLDYKRQGGTERLSVELASASVMELELPFRGTAVKSATLNGKEVKGTIKPGFGRSIYVVRTPVMKKADLAVKVAQELPLGVPQFREVEVGSNVELAVEGGRITGIQDAQGVLKSSKVSAGKAHGVISDNVGNNRVLALVEMGKKAPQYRIFDFKVRDPKAEAYTAEKNLRQAPADAKWTGIDLSNTMNGRITDIFRQEYLSPRPDTMSLRLAKDGYLIWNALYAGKKPPAIDLSLTRPPRPAPVYEAPIGDMKLGPEVTIEAWVWADIGESGGPAACTDSWASTRILEIGDFSVDIMARCGRLVRMNAPNPIMIASSPFCGDRMTHMAIVFRPGKSGEVYFDGKKWFAETAPVDWTKLPLSMIRLGANKAGTARLMGRIDRVAISNKAATPEQLQNRALDAAPLEGTIADWRIPESGGAQVASAVAGSPTLERKDVPFTRPKDLPPSVPVVDGMLQVPQGARFKWNPGVKDIAFTSLWDNWPRKVEVPVNRKGDSAWLLVAGSTNPMQVRIANAVLRFEYADGVKEELELVNPMNFWSLCPFLGEDYYYPREGFSLPKDPPSQVQLGTNCRAMVYGWKLRPGVELKKVTLESLSQEVVIGLMGLSVMNEKP